MTSTITRIIAAAGTVALVAGAGLVAAPAAHADGDYYGTWNLVSLSDGTDKVKCEGPATGPDQSMCPGGQTLTLKPNYRYAMTRYILIAMLLGQKGTFVAPVFPGTGERVLVFLSDTGQAQPLGSAYSMTLLHMRHGSPTKMILSVGTDEERVELTFRRASQ